MLLRWRFAEVDPRGSQDLLHHFVRSERHYYIRTHFNRARLYTLQSTLGCISAVLVHFIRANEEVLQIVGKVTDGGILFNGYQGWSDYLQLDFGILANPRQAAYDKLNL